MHHDFFDGIEQVKLKVDGGTASFPIFYRDARMFTIMLPANLLKLKRMLPDVRFVPAQVAPGVGAVGLTAFEYYDTDIKPYNEFSMEIFLNSPYFAPVPGYNVLRQYFARLYSVYIYHLPVTTEIALRGGIDFYNYPKFLAGIEFSDTERRITCDLSRDGENILTVSGEKVRTGYLGEMKFLCNLYHFRQPQLAEFKVNVVEGSINWMPTDISCAFNTSSDIGREFSDVVLGDRALMYLYMPKIQAILYGPENYSMPLLDRAMKAGLAPQAARKAVAKKPPARKAAARKRTGAK
ncbi:MAG: acetoacetate decarboxylase family protein [Actinobacteria bacterium]|nr:acetoacetate decarboxylase family protein [Actinomycetota bacterium]